MMQIPKVAIPWHRIFDSKSADARLTLAFFPPFPFYALLHALLRVLEPVNQPDPSPRSGSVQCEDFDADGSNVTAPASLK